MILCVRWNAMHFKDYSCYFVYVLFGECPILSLSSINHCKTMLCDWKSLEVARLFKNLR